MDISPKVVTTTCIYSFYYSWYSSLTIEHKISTSLDFYMFITSWHYDYFDIETRFFEGNFKLASSVVGGRRRLLSSAFLKWQPAEFEMPLQSGWFQAQSNGSYFYLRPCSLLFVIGMRTAHGCPLPERSRGGEARFIAADIVHNAAMRYYSCNWNWRSLLVKNVAARDF